MQDLGYFGTILAAAAIGTPWRLTAASCCRLGKHAVAGDGVLAVRDYLSHLVTVVKRAIAMVNKHLKGATGR